METFSQSGFWLAWKMDIYGETLCANRIIHTSWKLGRVACIMMNILKISKS